MRRFLTAALVGFGAWTSILAGGEPEARWSCGEEASLSADEVSAFRAGWDRRQLAVSLTVTFEKPGLFARSAAATNWHDLGFCRLRLDAAHRLEVMMLPARDELRALPLVLASQESVEYGRVYDIAFSFSAERRRYSLYLNGSWQMDNAVPRVPDRLRIAPADWHDFPGKVQRYVVYDMALGSEELTPATATPELLASSIARANRLGERGNAALASWGADLAARFRTAAEGLAARTLSIARLKRLTAELAKAERLVPIVRGDQTFVTYAVDPTSQEMYLPSRLPRDGRVAERLRFFAAQGENTFGSVFVVPLVKTDAFTVRFTPLKDAAGHSIPADRVETKLVKCWFRSGGAWMAYQGDKLTRVLTPDLLLNDETVVKVDAFRESNARLLHLPEGARYVDCSRNGEDQHEYYMTGGKTKLVPFRDAKTLQSVRMDEVGRGQQYLFTFRIPENQAPGFYRGTLELLADGRVVDAKPVTLRVLPFVLPEARTYYDLDRTYFCHVNLGWGVSRFPLKPQYEVLAKYNFRHPSNILDSDDTYAWAKAADMDMRNILSAPAPAATAWEAPWGGPSREIPEDAAEKLDRLFLEKWQNLSARFKDKIRDAVLYPVFTSEQDHYRATKELPDRPENIYHVHTNVKRFSHSMTEKFIFGALDGTDMDSAAQIHREWADMWHAAGARVISYAEPFPSSENPAWFRRKLGLELYKMRYDGHMMHGFLSPRWNEFTDWPEDPAYRNFGLAYFAEGGIVERLCLVGCAEGYNDVRYATQLRLTCTAALRSKDPVVVKEAKRQLAWLETVDGVTYDMRAFRQGCADRILTLQDLVQARKEAK